MKIFADTDICLDLLTGRKPFNNIAEKLFTLADLGKIKIHVSSLSFSNIDYLLKSQYKSNESRKILLRFKTLVTVLAVDDKIIDLALASDFNDFEDALQNFSAEFQKEIHVIVTRNTKDFKTSSLSVMTPETYLRSIQK